jgi:hypothetical protein
MLYFYLYNKLSCSELFNYLAWNIGEQVSKKIKWEQVVCLILHSWWWCILTASIIARAICCTENDSVFLCLAYCVPSMIPNGDTQCWWELALIHQFNSAMQLDLKNEQHWLVECSCTKCLWDVMPCSPVEVYWCFRGKYCLHLQGWRASNQKSPVLHLRWWYFSYSLPQKPQIKHFTIFNHHYYCTSNISSAIPLCNILPKDSQTRAHLYTVCPF